MRIRQFTTNDLYKNVYDNIDPKEEGLVINASEIIYRLLKILTPKQSIIVSMLYKGFSYSEISRLLKVDKTTIRDHLKLIRDKARNIIKEIYVK